MGVAEVGEVGKGEAGIEEGGHSARKRSPSAARPATQAASARGRRRRDRRRERTNDHCANHPCSVTFSPSPPSPPVVTVLSGHPPLTHGFPGLVSNNLPSSTSLSAPSRSRSNDSKRSVKKA